MAPDIERAGAEMSIWHLFSVIALIAAVISANNVAKMQHVSLGPYALCIVLGIVVGVLTGIGSFGCARAAQVKVEGKGQPAKVAILLLLVVLSIGWIVFADWSGRWIPTAALHLFGFR